MKAFFRAIVALCVLVSASVRAESLMTTTSPSSEPTLMPTYYPEPSLMPSAFPSPTARQEDYDYDHRLDYFNSQSDLLLGGLENATYPEPSAIPSYSYEEELPEEAPEDGAEDPFLQIIDPKALPSRYTRSLCLYDDSAGFAPCASLNDDEVTCNKIVPPSHRGVGRQCYFNRAMSKCLPLTHNECKLLGSHDDNILSMTEYTKKRMGSVFPSPPASAKIWVTPLAKLFVVKDGGKTYWASVVKIFFAGHGPSRRLLMSFYKDAARYAPSAGNILVRSFGCSSHRDPLGSLADYSSMEESIPTFSAKGRYVKGWLVGNQFHHAGALHEENGEAGMVQRSVSRFWSSLTPATIGFVTKTSVAYSVDGKEYYRRQLGVPGKTQLFLNGYRPNAADDRDPARWCSEADSLPKVAYCREADADQPVLVTLGEYSFSKDDAPKREVCCERERMIDGEKRTFHAFFREECPRP